MLNIPSFLKLITKKFVETFGSTKPIVDICYEIIRNKRF